MVWSHEKNVRGRISCKDENGGGGGGKKTKRKTQKQVDKWGEVRCGDRSEMAEEDELWRVLDKPTHEYNQKGR